MRLRIPEILDERGLSYYELAKRSNGRISESTAHRYVFNKGQMRYFDGKIIEAICDILDVEIEDVLELESRKRKRGTTGEKGDSRPASPRKPDSLEVRGKPLSKKPR